MFHKCTVKGLEEIPLQTSWIPNKNKQWFSIRVHYLSSDKVIKTVWLCKLHLFLWNISSALRISSQLCQGSLMFRFFLFSMTHSNSWRQFSMGHCHFCMSSKCGTNYPLFWMLFKDVYTYKIFEDRDSISFWGKEQAYLTGHYQIFRFPKLRFSLL